MNYGIDWDEVVSPEPESVEVPPTFNPLSDQEYTQLSRTFNPLDLCSDSVDVFCAVKAFVHRIA